MAKLGRGASLNDREVQVMSQIVYSANQKKHRDSVGEVIYDRYTISASTSPVNGLERDAVRKIVEFLRREGLIKIHKEYSDKVDNKPNTGYEVTLTAKGIKIATDRSFHDYYRELDNKEYERRLGLREKKANIYVPIIALLVSILISVYTANTSSDATSKTSLQIDSLKQKTVQLKKRVDSLANLKPRVDTIIYLKNPDLNKKPLLPVKG